MLLLYVAACVLSLLVIVASDGRWFGVARDPLSGIYAIVLGLPWSVVSDRVADRFGAFGGMAFVVAGMAANAMLLFLVCRGMSLRSSVRKQAEPTQES